MLDIVSYVVEFSVELSGLVLCWQRQFATVMSMTKRDIAFDLETLACRDLDTCPIPKP